MPLFFLRSHRRAQPSSRADSRRASVAARLLGLRVRILPGAWMSCIMYVLVWCQVEVSATGWSLVQRSPTECVCVSLGLIRCNSSPVHQQWVRVSRGQPKKSQETRIYSHTKYLTHSPPSPRMFHWPYEIWLDGANRFEISPSTTVLYGRISWRRLISREFLELPNFIRSIWQILDHKPNFPSKQCPSAIICSALGQKRSVLLNPRMNHFYIFCVSCFLHANRAAKRQIDSP